MQGTWTREEIGETLDGHYYVCAVMHYYVIDGRKVAEIEDSAGKWYADIYNGDGGKFRSLEDAQHFVEGGLDFTDRDALHLTTSEEVR